VITWDIHGELYAYIYIYIAVAIAIFIFIFISIFIFLDNYNINKLGQCRKFHRQLPSGEGLITHPFLEGDWLVKSRLITTSVAL
jgi:hypothetical protein